jgi:AraC-like DNA-binding protein
MKKGWKRQRPTAEDQHVVANASVRLGPLMTVPAVLREFNCEPEPILDAAGLTLAQFENPDDTVPYVVASQLLARCVRATGCEHFGLLVGAQVGGSHLGIAGHMLRFAPDVGTALHDLVYHLDLHDRGGIPTFMTHGSVALLGYAILQTEVEATAPIYDLAIAIACNILRDLCGENWNPAEVLLARRQPGDVTPYRRFFRAPLRFDADQSAVMFPNHWLARPLPGADPLLHRHLMEEADKLRVHHAADLVGEVHQTLRQSLQNQMSSLTEVARQLGVHERTLNRRLRAEGTTFQHELDAVRYAVTRHFLTESSMTLNEIALALNYADASAFSRAFKRWSGVTPGRWRADHAPRGS